MDHILTLSVSVSVALNQHPLLAPSAKEKTAFNIISYVSSHMSLSER